MYVTVVVAEEPRSKIKTFLIAPEGTFIRIGETVRADNMNFNVLFVSNYHKDDDEICTALASGFGAPDRITSIIREEEIEWEEDE